MATFTVYGHPATKGSTVSFMGSGGRIVTRADCKNLGAWSQAVAWAAKAARVRCAPKDTSVRLNITFWFLKSKSVTRTDHTVKPDIDKLLRAILDALSNGVAYEDDSQVTGVEAVKAYGVESATIITVW